MVCWLKFLNFVNESLKKIEPNLVRRKKLAIELLKKIEREEGHNIKKIEERIKNEGEEGIIKIAEEMLCGKEEKKKKRKKKEEIEVRAR